MSNIVNIVFMVVRGLYFYIFRTYAIIAIKDIGQVQSGHGIKL